MTTRRLYLKAALAGAAAAASGCAIRPVGPHAGTAGATRAEVLRALHLANGYWQRTTAPALGAFWDVAAYLSGNIEA
jgi:hypothetical protein